MHYHLNKAIICGLFLAYLPGDGKMDEELTKRKDEIERTIGILEWDQRLGQINPAKKAHLEAYKNELTGINAKLKPELIIGE